jgi:hypothetical protein
MAVLDEVPGLEVQIAVNGEVLQEYYDRIAKVSKTTVERYIEAQSNTIFEIRYAFKEPFPVDRCVSMIVTIDGKDLDEPIIRPFELFNSQGHMSRGPISQLDGRWVVQPYCFAPIDISKFTKHISAKYCLTYSRREWRINCFRSLKDEIEEHWPHYLRLLLPQRSTAESSPPCCAQRAGRVTACRREGSQGRCTFTSDNVCDQARQ